MPPWPALNLVGSGTFTGEISDDPAPGASWLEDLPAGTQWGDIVLAIGCYANLQPEEGAGNVLYRGDSDRGSPILWQHASAGLHVARVTLDWEEAVSPETYEDGLSWSVQYQVWRPPANMTYYPSVWVLNRDVSGAGTLKEAVPDISELSDAVWDQTAFVAAFGLLYWASLQNLPSSPPTTELGWDGAYGGWSTNNGVWGILADQRSYGMQQGVIGTEPWDVLTKHSHEMLYSVAVHCPNGTYNAGGAKTALVGLYPYQDIPVFASHDRGMLGQRLVAHGIAGPSLAVRRYNGAWPEVQEAEVTVDTPCTGASLLYVCGGAKSAPAILEAVYESDGAILLAQSRDNGRTWGVAETIAASGYQNPCHERDEARGVLSVMMQATATGSWYQTTKQANDTWSSPALVTAGLSGSASLRKRNDGMWEFVFVNASGAVQMLTCRNPSVAQAWTWA